MTEKGEVAVDSRIGPPMLRLNIFGGILRARFESGAHLHLEAPYFFGGDLRKESFPEPERPAARIPPIILWRCL